MASHVCVLDTSALVDFKSLIPVSEQWSAFKTMEQMVLDGSIAMPRQVLTEASEVAHPDMPGAWAAGQRKLLVHPLDAAVDPYVKHVMSVAGDVVEAGKDAEEADPYVVALALEIANAGYEVCVVTSDRVDHGQIKIALATACDRLGVKVSSPPDFLTSKCGVACKSTPKHPSADTAKLEDA